MKHKKNRLNTKLTPEIVLSCRYDYVSGVSARELALKEGVALETMLKALRGDTWKSVEMPPLLKQKIKDSRHTKYFRGCLAGSGLTVEEIIAIREKFATGSYDIRSLAMEFNISWDSCNRIVRGWTFTKIPGPIVPLNYSKPSRLLI